jgi:hypothetical protein
MLSRFAAFLISAIIFSTLLSAQAINQIPAAGLPDATARLQSSLTMLTGKSPVTDITLTGVAERIAGSDDESGRATLKAMVTGEESTDFAFPSGTRREVRLGSGSRREGHWSGPDGVWHTMPEHNLKAEGVWFSPALLFSQLLADKTRAFQHLGTALVEGQPLEHIKVRDESPRIPDKAPSQVAQLMQHLTEIDLYLDPDTSLPLKLAFNEHPDNDASRDIPVEIRFSDYRSVNGTQVPFRLQKFINGTLLLDVRVELATLNSNLAAGAFAVQ